MTRGVVASPGPAAAVSDLAREQEKAAVRAMLFYVTFALIMGHELDAMTHDEWRLLPGLNRLSGEEGRVAFVALHVPLIAGLLWIHARGGWLFHALFGGFCAIHVVLHAAFHGHPLYTFDGPLSDGLIGGAGLAGAALAVVSLRARAGA